MRDRLAKTVPFSKVALDNAVIKMMMTNHFRIVVVMMVVSIVFQESSTRLFDWQILIVATTIPRSHGDDVVVYAEEKMMR
jgi:hypothetical protein